MLHDSAVTHGYDLFFALRQTRNLVHKFNENGMPRLFHRGVVGPLDFVKLRLLVSVNLHHALQVGIFLVAAQQFQFPVARDQQERRGITAHVIERCHLVDHWLGTAPPLFFADGHMRDGLTAQRDDPGPWFMSSPGM